MPAFAPIASFPVASGPTFSVSGGSSLPAITVGLSSCFGYITAGDIASRALRLILVESPDAPLEPDEYADFLGLMNSYMDSVEADGIRLGYNRVCNISDIVTIPDGAIRGLVANMAIEMAPMFGGKVSAALIKQAQDGYKTMLRLGVHVSETLYPCNLPVGSGSCGYVRTPYCEMTLAGNRRQTVIEAAASAKKAQGVWNVGKHHGLVPDVSGRITCVSRGTYTLSADLAITAESTVSNGFVGITRNNIIELYVDTSFSTDPTRSVITGEIALEAGDFIDIVLADYSSTVNLTLVDGVVSLS